MVSKSTVDLFASKCTRIVSGMKSSIVIDSTMKPIYRCDWKTFRENCLKASKTSSNQMRRPTNSTTRIRKTKIRWFSSSSRYLQGERIGTNAARWEHRENHGVWSFRGQFQSEDIRRCANSRGESAATESTILPSISISTSTRISTARKSFTQPRTVKDRERISPRWTFCSAFRWLVVVVIDIQHGSLLPMMIALNVERWLLKAFQPCAIALNVEWNVQSIPIKRRTAIVPSAEIPDEPIDYVLFFCSTCHLSTFWNKLSIKMKFIIRRILSTSVPVTSSMRTWRGITLQMMESNPTTVPS